MLQATNSTANFTTAFPGNATEADFKFAKEARKIIEVKNIKK
jgi:hypothetical protein